MLLKLAEKNYFFFKRPIKYYMSYLKGPDKNEMSSSNAYLHEVSDDIIQQKIKEIEKIGVNTYSLVLLWSSLKSIAKLCQRIYTKSPQIMNYTYDPAKEDK